MQHFSKDVVYQYNDPTNRAVGAVADGETFSLATELASGDWLHSLDDKWDPTMTSGNNPCVMVNVDGARPGDVLAVTIEEIRPDTIGYMAIGSEDAVYPEFTRRHFGEVFSNSVKIEDGIIHVTDRLRVPIAPLIGTLGTTIPVGSESHVKGGFYGGNMDVQEVRVGATVRLPVSIWGAGLNVGDIHARQSDAELSAVETRATVVLTVRIERPSWPIAGPLIEDATHLSALALDDDLKVASEKAFVALHRWLVEGYSLTAQEAYLLIGAVGEARCTRLLEPGNYPYIWKVGKEFLP